MMSPKKGTTLLGKLGIEVHLLVTTIRFNTAVSLARIQFYSRSASDTGRIAVFS